jgi:DNA-binding CsgD family transcriptional regulator
MQDKISRTLESTLDVLASPVFICNGNMNIQFCNAAAQKILKRGNTVSSRQNRLNFISAQANIKIRHKVHAYARHDFAADTLNPNLFTPVELPLSPSCFAFVSALPDEENSQRSIFGTMFERPVMIMLIDPAGNSNVRIEIVQSIFGVTRAEAALACALAKGMSPSEFADEKNISRNTVRVQTQALLNKMGARRRSDITRMLATAFSGLDLG